MRMIVIQWMVENIIRRKKKRTRVGNMNEREKNNSHREKNDKEMTTLGKDIFNNFYSFISRSVLGVNFTRGTN